MEQELATPIWTLIPAQPINKNRQLHIFTLQEKLEGQKPGLKIPKSTPPETVDLVIFDPRFSLGTLMRANYAT